MVKQLELDRSEKESKINHLQHELELIKKFNAVLKSEKDQLAKELRSSNLAQSSQVTQSVAVERPLRHILLSDQEKEEFCQKIDDLTKQLKKSEEDRLKLYNAQQKFVNMQSQLEEKLKQSEQNRNIVLKQYQGLEK